MIRDQDPFTDLFQAGAVFGIPKPGHASRHPDPYPASGLVTVRTYNLCMREGMQTVGDFLNLSLATVAGWRNAGKMTVEEVDAMQSKLRALRSRPGPAKFPGEGLTAFTIRSIGWEAWWRGHDAGCPESRDCGSHENPFDQQEGW